MDGRTTRSPAGRIWSREPLLDEYYRERGCDDRGLPTPEKLAALGLG